MTNIIEVSFGGGSIAYVKVDTAYFYNNGIIFKPTDIDLPASYQVHWADSPQASSTLETIGTAEGAPIPDDLWNRSRVIYGWIYLHPTEDSGITAYEVRIYKNVRAGLPDGTEPTPAEQSTIDQLIGALNSAVEQAEDAQEAIEDMSVSATTLAEGSPATVTKSEQDGVVHLAFGIPKGQTGDDGYSPTANVSKTGKTATITITDKNGTTSAQVEDGEDGIDGISPSVSVTDITGGHRVVITDKDGAKSFDVEDGATGATPNLTIGTVTTLEPDASATATITGTAEDPVLNLGIPRGQTGEVTEEEFTQLKEDLNSETDYLKSKNYDTRLATLNTMGIGHFVSGSTPATNGNYVYYRHTPLIPLRDLTITIDTPIDSGLYMIVSLFDANGEFVRVTRNGVNMTSATYSATKHWITLYGQYEEPYVRFEFYRYPYADITNDITVTFTDDSENVSVKVDRINNATLDDMSITFDTNDFVTGYLNTSGVLVENNEYKTSPFIAVNDQMVVTIGELMTTVWRTVFCYDAEQILIESIEYNGKITTTLRNYDVFLPHGTSYIRFVIGANRLSVASVTYKMVNIPYHHLAPSLLEHWNDQTFGKMNGLFKQATTRSLITIIDDDTANSEYVTLFHDACVAQGIKGSYAIIPSRFNLDSTLKDTLLDYEEEGFGMCAHCYVQDSKWNNPVTNMSECEADMIKCIRDMQSAGFINFRHWLTPAGHVESAVQDLAKRLGMQCAVSSGWHEIETTQAKYGRYALRRCSLEAADGTGALTVNDFKALIDDAVACNGWLLITTHMGNGNWDATAIANRFDAVVDYAQSKYMKFTTLQEAWAIRRPIYEFYEQF